MFLTHGIYSWTEAMDVPGAVFSDLDEAHNRLLFGVEQAPGFVQHHTHAAMPRRRAPARRQGAYVALKRGEHMLQR